MGNTVPAAHVAGVVDGDNASKAFALIDRNGDGAISPSEFAVLLRLQGHICSDTEVADLVAHVNGGKDTITLDQFKAILKAGGDDPIGRSSAISAASVPGSRGPLRRFVVPVWKLVEETNRRTGTPVSEKVHPPSSHGSAALSGWQRSLARVLDSEYVQGIMVLMIVIDVFLIWGEIILHFTATDLAHDCVTEGCPATIFHDSHSTATHVQEQWEDVLHFSSLGILALLLLHTLLLLVAYGKHFFENPLHVADFIVLSAALALESSHVTAGPFVVILLSWRIVRFVHAALVIADEYEHSSHEAEDRGKKTANASFSDRMKLQLDQQMEGRT